MKRLAVFTALSCMLLLLAQCSPKPRASMASTAVTPKEKVEEVKAKFSDADITAGKAIVEDKCNRCHKIKKPENFTVAKLEKVLPKMVNYAKLDDVAAGQVRAYMLSNAKVE